MAPLNTEHTLFPPSFPFIIFALSSRVSDPGVKKQALLTPFPTTARVLYLCRGTKKQRTQHNKRTDSGRRKKKGVLQ